MGQGLENGARAVRGLGTPDVLLRWPVHRGVEVAAAAIVVQSGPNLPGGDPPAAKKLGQPTDKHGYLPCYFHSGDTVADQFIKFII